VAKAGEMKWTVKLGAELGQGEALEREIATIEREGSGQRRFHWADDRRREMHHGGPAARTGDSSDGTAWSRHPVLSAMRKSFADKGLLPIHSAVRIRKDPDACLAD
jgi:hypothetical protein